MRDRDRLVERLKELDPATPEGVTLGSRDADQVRSHIVARDPDQARRDIVARDPDELSARGGARRRRTGVVIAAAIVAAAVVVPIALLSPLGDGGEPVATSAPTVTPSAGWRAVAPLVDVQRDGIVYDQVLRVFVIANGDEPFSLSAVSPHRDDLGERVLWCRSAEWFVAPHGEAFDRYGHHMVGPASGDLTRVDLRVTDGIVEVDPSSTRPLIDHRPETFAGTICGSDGELAEAQPGFAAPAAEAPAPIEVLTPVRNQVLTSPVTVSGTADVFEATVSIRIIDEMGNVIADTFSTATCGTGCRGDFSEPVSFTIDHEQPGVIELFEVSAEDGSALHRVRVPVTLLPGPPDEIAAALQGTWEEADGTTVGDGREGRPLVLHTFAGASHCGWTSVTFLHAAWPLGSTNTDPSEPWRQYARDSDGVLASRERAAADPDGALPKDATSSGFSRGSWQLWTSPDDVDTAVYLVNIDTNAVERWPRIRPPAICL